MAIRKRGTKWVVDVTSRKDGVRIRETFATKKEAVAREAEIRRDIRRHAAIDDLFAWMFAIIVIGGGITLLISLFR